VRTQTGAVALNTTVIAANGRSTVSFEETSDVVTSVVAGTTEASALSGSLYRAGAAAENVTLADTDTKADTFTGKVSSTQLTGSFTLNRETPLDVPVSMSAVAATYRFVGPDQLTWRATIAGDGAITASSGSCAFSGTASLPSNQHNTFVLELKAGTCAPFSGSVTAVAFLDAIPRAASRRAVRRCALCTRRMMSVWTCCGSGSRRAWEEHAKDVVVLPRRGCAT